MTEEEEEGKGVVGVDFAGGQSTLPGSGLVYVCVWVCVWLHASGRGVNRLLAERTCHIHVAPANQGRFEQQPSSRGLTSPPCHVKKCR